ncbi:MAG: phosphoribosylaminoimidazolesuccinocarboxamide synthase [Candidatus Heimdallarchaeota archaeon]|nr:phosphoribosylaminoimidazolesuccinocarboxamide synthase [Candidatus Heimdallarchaeota archaeon]
MVDKKVEKKIKEYISDVFLKAELEGYGERNSGKVRDIYELEKEIILITTDRISAFDRILKQGIPYKGQALNQTSAFWFEETEDIVKNHVRGVPDPNVMVVQKCEPIDIEVVIRGYITGSAWRKYEKLKEKGEPLVISGVEFPKNLRKNEKLPEPVFTPTTKAKSGHDQEITPEEIVSRGIVSEELLEKITEIAFKLYNRGNKVVSKEGGILVDTKYEFGLNHEGELVLIDEVHTADSSRYWLQENYEEAFEKEEKQKGLDKEYVRRWLRNQGFMGDGEVPNLPEEVIVNAATNVIGSYELITGQKFKPAKEYTSNNRIQKNLNNYYKK